MLKLDKNSIKLIKMEREKKDQIPMKGTGQSFNFSIHEKILLSSSSRLAFILWYFYHLHDDLLSYEVNWRE